MAETRAILAALLLAACATPPATRPPTAAEDVELLKASCTGGVSVKMGSIGLSSSTLPCEILRTYAAVEATEGRGWFMGSTMRFFLHARLFSKGVFSMFAGLVGLG